MTLLLVISLSSPSETFKRLRLPSKRSETIDWRVAYQILGQNSSHLAERRHFWSLVKGIQICFILSSRISKTFYSKFQKIKMDKSLHFLCRTFCSLFVEGRGNYSQFFTPPLFVDLQTLPPISQILSPVAAKALLKRLWYKSGIAEHHH